MSFDKLAQRIARGAGRPSAFVTAVVVMVAWAASGPVFGFSDTWQLVVNTGTTIVTFLMVFLIQNTQTRDMEALQVKLDELIRVTHGARPALLNLEELGSDELERIKAGFMQLGRQSGGEIDT